MIDRASQHRGIVRAGARAWEPYVHPVRDHFRKQAEACLQLGSPFTARVLQLAADRLDDTSAVGRAVLDWSGDPSAAALALRFAGSLHALVLSDTAPALARIYARADAAIDRATLWSAMADALDRHEATVLRFLESPPQTNEVARCGVLLGGFLAIARLTGRPLVLLEIGASAGLNLRWDDYGYDFGAASWGPRDGPLRLAPAWRGPLPMLGPVEVRARHGCDRRPLDPGSPSDRLRLRAYVWADQAARLARLEAALDHAARRGTRVEQADAADWVEARLALRHPGLTTVLFHSIVWQYLPPHTQQRIAAALERAGAAGPDTPLAWLRMEPASDSAHAELRLTTWPHGREQLLADADFHGRWVSWRAD
jgi:hypothetical protein